MSAVYLAVFVICTLLSFVVTRRVRNLAASRGWAATAPSGHHIHQSPVPRLGGVAIFTAFICAIALAVTVSAGFALDTHLVSRPVYWILGAASVVFLLGLFDDVYSAPPVAKFLVEGLAAVMLYFGGFGFFSVPLTGGPLAGWASLALTILWVLLITNAFNLIDGIDGLAAGSALFSTLTVFVISLASSNSMVSILALALAGAILGFLRFNFNPATIFLGDSGSLFIGFMLSALALAGTQKSSTAVAVAIPVVSFGLPILETLISVIRRFMNGQPLFVGDRQHIHHKLLERGLTQRQSVIILYAVSALCGLLSLLLLNPSGPTVGIVLFVIGAGVWVGVQHLGYHEFFEIRRVAQRTIDQKKIIINNLAIRRAGEGLSGAGSLEAICKILGQAFEANDFDRFHLELPPWRYRCASDLSPHSQFDGPYAWQKQTNEISFERSHLPAWSLKLELLDAAQQSVGAFTVYRACNDKPLLVDINLLTTEFRAALAAAVARVTESADDKPPLAAGM
ncbi:MAG TPA: MraY family glycosyltransferase [Blastocatellia bacterium]|nr:MraY family glycosyltransferase [Blastocatellia bacterium]